MASKRIIEVRISGSLKEQKKKEPKNDIDSDLKSNSLFDNAFVFNTAKQVANELSEMAMYGINRHLQLTDDYIGERYLNNGLQVINRTKSMGHTIIAGAAIGGVVGAAVGVVLAVADLTFDIVKNYDQQNIHIRQMDAQLQYQRQRAGYSLTSGSIGENK